MKLFLVVLSGLLAIACAAPADEGRIVGGANALLGQFPHQVSLRSNGRHFCGGTIVGARYVVTAAHCNIGSVSAMSVWAGSVSLSSGGDEYAVRAVIVHPGWNTATLENDIALVHLTSDIKFNNNVQPIAITTTNIGSDAPVRTSGWGYTSYPGSTPDALQWIDLKTISAERCKSLHTGSLADSQICTLTRAGEGVCSGDSGGPLVADGKLVGVTSAAYLCALGRPDFFTRVYSFNSWLNTNMN